MKHKSHCTGFLHPTLIEWKLLGTNICIFIFHLSQYAFLEAAVNSSPLRIFVDVKIIVGGESYRRRRFHFCFSLFCVIAFPQTKISLQSSCFCFLWNRFTSRFKNTWLFWGNFFCTKKGRHICLQWWVWQGNDIWFIFKVFYCEFVGDKIIFTSHKLFDIFSPQLIDTKLLFFNVFLLSLLPHRKNLSRKECTHDPIFFEKPTFNRFKRVT